MKLPLAGIEEAKDRDNASSTSSIVSSLNVQLSHLPSQQDESNMLARTKAERRASTSLVPEKPRTALGFSSSLTSIFAGAKDKTPKGKGAGGDSSAATDEDRMETGTL
jgi:hypothetical protein